MGVVPADITNRVIIFLFIKNLYNCDIQNCIADAKTINTLADAFKVIHQSLFKFKNMNVFCMMKNMKYQKYNNRLA